MPCLIYLPFPFFFDRSFAASDERAATGSDILCNPAVLHRLSCRLQIDQLKKMKVRELLNLVQVTEARVSTPHPYPSFRPASSLFDFGLVAAALQVRELELENARTRLQMTFMPDRVHGSGHGGKPWA